DAAIPDAALLESTPDDDVEPRRAPDQVWRRVPARADEDQRSERHDRPHELREPLHEPGGRRSAPGTAVAAGAHQLHGHGSGAGHAVLFRTGRLSPDAPADVEPWRPLR